MPQLKSIKSTFARFRANTDGNVAVITAVGGLAVASVVALAIDTTGAQSAKQELQSHLDVVALAIITSGITEAQEQKSFAHEVLTGNSYAIDTSKLSILMTDQGEVRVTGAIDYSNAFSGVWGKDKSDIKAISSAIAGASVSEPTDIVLVLDTTDSMEGAKLTALQSSANKLIDALSEANSDEIQMGMVPFSTYVNVGLEHRNAFWIDVQPDETKTETEFEQILVTEGYCRGNPNATLTRLRDGVPETYTGCDDEVPAVYEDGAEITTTSTETWGGCVLSRAQGDGRNGLNLTDENYVNQRVSSYNRGDHNCSDPLVPLTNQLETVSTSINALEANWDTYMPAGIVWGWRVLSPQEPFTQAQSDSKKIMVLMTDGVNSLRKVGRAHGRVDPTDPEQVEDLDLTNQDTATLCQNVKNDEIEIFTIAYDVSDLETKAMLSTCASSSGNYFDASNAQQLESAFLKIGDNITEGSAVRLTR